MFRLIPGLRARARRRLAGEHGASAVVLALMLVPVLGATAIAVDVGSLYAERARLQVAADAAALAVAQDCARGLCGDVLGTAQDLVTANAPGATAEHPLVTTLQGVTADVVAGATTLQPNLLSAPVRVTVRARATQEHWFAPVIGHDASTVRASATVTWGGPSRGTAVLPLTFSWCEFLQQTGGGIPSTTVERTIYFTKTSNTVGCTGPSRNIVPGGFAYLDTPPARCEAASAINERSYSSTGNTPPSTCQPGYFSALVGTTVLLPLFDESGATGSNAWYHVFGYAAFRITGFHLGGQFSTTPRPCGGNDRCISGHFTRLVELSDAWEHSPTAPLLGGAVLRLIR